MAGFVCCSACCAVTAFAQLSSPTSTFDANQAAQTLSDQVGAKLGSKAGIGQNAVNPLTAGAPMTSMTGTTPFYAPNMSCPSSSNFLTVTIVPDNSSGDIANVYVQQDTNFDNSFDYSYTAPVRVSGVCGNGVISCDAGTWNNCQYFKWSADSSGRASLVSCILQDLGGCFCVNNNCGNALVVNEMDYILTVLGGGIAGAVQAVNPKWTVSSSSSSFMQISYTGQNIDKCVAPATNFASSTVNPQQLYNGGQGSLDTAAQAEVASETSNSTSAYNTIQAVSAGASSAGTFASCSLTSSATVSTSTQPTTNPIPYTMWLNFLDDCHTGGWTAYVDLDGVTVGSFYAPSEFVVNPPTIDLNITPGNHSLSLSYGSSCGYGFGGMAFTLTNDGTHVVDLETDGSWPNGSVAWWSSGIPSYLIIYNNSHPSNQYITSLSHQFTAALMVSTDTLTDPVATDNCISMETNTQCSLQNEVVDGVQTIVNYNPTGLAPIASCRNFTGQVQTFNVCHNWWSKSRTYFCKTAPAFDFSAIKARSANISTTSTAGGGAVTFQDKTPDGSGGLALFF